MNKIVFNEHVFTCAYESLNHFLKWKGIHILTNPFFRDRVALLHIYMMSTQRKKLTAVATHKQFDNHLFYRRRMSSTLMIAEDKVETWEVVVPGSLDLGELTSSLWTSIEKHTKQKLHNLNGGCNTPCFYTL